MEGVIDMKKTSIKNKGIISNSITVMEVIIEVVFGVYFSKKIDSSNIYC